MKASLTLGSFAASNISSTILKSNLVANLTVLRTLKGSSRKVYRGSNGVLTIPSIKS